MKYCEGANFSCIFTGRVLSPVIDALVPARPETQQNVARIVLKTFCEAWLEHIRSRRMKFRYTVDENPSKSLMLQHT